MRRHLQLIISYRYKRDGINSELSFLGVAISPYLLFQTCTSFPYFSFSSDPDYCTSHSLLHHHYSTASICLHLYISTLYLHVPSSSAPASPLPTNHIPSFVINPPRLGLVEVHPGSTPSGTGVVIPRDIKPRLCTSHSGRWE